METIILCSDSTYANIYLPSAARMHVQLQQALAALGKVANVVNYSIPGWDSNECLTTVQSNVGPGGMTQWAAVKAAQPDKVGLSFGRNDSGMGFTKAAYKANMQTMITEALAVGITPFLINDQWYQWGPTGGAQTDWINNAVAPYCDALAELASQYDLELVDIRTIFQAQCAAGNWDLWMHNAGTPADGEAYYANLHQMEQGTTYIAQAIAAVIAPLIVSPAVAAGSMVYTDGEWHAAAVQVRSDGAWIPAAMSVRENGEWK